MIRQLNSINFRQFGTILPEEDRAARHANYHCLPLSPDSSWAYQTSADTYLTGEAGVCVLSVSPDNKTYQDFFLSKSVLLRGGVWFRLTAFRDRASVQIAGFSLPRLIEIQPAQEFLVRPHLRVECLYTFFYQEKEQGFVFSGEAHPMPELTYVDQGTLHSVVDGKDLLMEQGELMLYAPNQWHMQYADIGIAPRYLTISFDVSGCDLSALTSRRIPASQKAVALLQRMLREQEQSEPHADDMLLLLLEELLILLLREENAPGDKPQVSHSVNNENEIIRRAQQYISLHLRERLSVPIVAQSIQVSASYLTALFHKHLQISPGEYIRRLKLQESKQMIREGKMNFTEIAQALQYSTVHHFSRQFKEKFGMTPTEYAKSVR